MDRSWNVSIATLVLSTNATGNGDSYGSFLFCHAFTMVPVPLHYKSQSLHLWNRKKPWQNRDIYLQGRYSRVPKYMRPTNNENKNSAEDNNRHRSDTNETHYFAEDGNDNDCPSTTSKDTTCSSTSTTDSNASTPSSNIPTNKREPITTLASLVQSEQEASRRLLQQLMIPARIAETITFAAQLFVVIGILLNINGYGYVIHQQQDLHHHFSFSWIGIDTLENRQFQIELRKN